MEQMKRLSMCRICLVQDVRMFAVTDKIMQEVYQRLTDIPFVTEDRRPMLACFFCYAKLKQCCQMKIKCLTAEQLLAQTLKEYDEQKPLIFRGRLEFCGGLEVMSTEVISIVDGCQIEYNHIKEELPSEASVERRDSVKLKDALQFEDSDDDLLFKEFKIEVDEDEELIYAKELVPENPEFSIQGQASLLQRHDEPDLEDDLHLTNAQTIGGEVPQVPQKRRKAEPAISCFICHDTSHIPSTCPKRYTKKEDTAASSKQVNPCSRASHGILETSEINMKANAEPSKAPSTSVQHTSIGVNDKKFNATNDEWVKLIDDLSDCDMDVEDEECLLPMNSTNASAEPSAQADLTAYETRVLEIVDQQNDLAVRELVPHDCHDFNWTRDRKIFTGQRENFTGAPGPTFTMTDQTRIVDIFYKMIDNDFLDLICTETNRYADQKIKRLKDQNCFLPTTRLYRWTPTDREEIISFLTIIILQGLYPLPDEESYFGFNGFGTMPYFSKVMSYNRFLLIKSLMHFVDNETITEPNKLCKIQPVADYFNDKFSSMYYPSQDIVIDESLLQRRGRLDFAQKILSKAGQVGVKTYELCESSSGYLWKFIIYAGKDKSRTATTTTTAGINVDDTDERPEETETTDQLKTGTSDARPSYATAKIVFDLVQPLLHRGHTLIMDNFYNSPLLARCLKRQQTDCYGTLRLNREFVPDSLKTLTKTELRQGEVMVSYCTDLSIIVWRDSTLVSMISTYHDLQISPKQKFNRLGYKPSVVLNYNKAMGGVDRKDQFLSAQPLERRKNRIWYKKVFRRLFNCAIFNCFIIFKTANNNITHRQFRITLAEDLLKIHRHIDLTTEPKLIISRHGRKTTKPRKAINRPRLEHRHFPVRNGFKQSRCCWCAQKSVTRRTVWKCLECDVNLCIENCFLRYHI